MLKRIIVTGSNGLVGSAVCEYFAERGFEVHGLDNDQRAVFLGPQAGTRWNQQRLESSLRNFHHHEADIRDRAAISDLLGDIRPAVVAHTAAQPSHDRAAAIPFDDFDTNAVGTLNLLEACRKHCPDTVFAHMSTNKVYGDRPNHLSLVELDKRWEFADGYREHGIPETLPIDQCLHSLFGASKVASDVLVQEYGRYFKMPTCCMRAGCLTGPYHSGVELHGFLSYLVKCNVEEREYTIYGYGGKQVRDNLQCYDVAAFIHEFSLNPRCGEVYNLGGGKGNSCSILEAFQMVEEVTGKRQRFKLVEQNRTGDHICYYSDLRKIQAHYPNWQVSHSLPQIIREIYESWQRRLTS